MKFPWRKPLPEFQVTRKNTSLLVIDMQYLDAHWDYGIVRKARDSGFAEDLLYYKNRLREIVPNIQRLQKGFREKKMEVIHTRIQSLTMDGRDRSYIHKALQIHAAPGSKEAEFLEELAPRDNEIMFSKTSASAFNSTNIDYVLKNLGITCIIIVGVATSGCVETMARDASERNYYTIVVEDACGALFEELHKAAIHNLSDVFAKIKTTSHVLDAIEGL